MADYILLSDIKPSKVHSLAEIRKIKENMGKRGIHHHIYRIEYIP